ncbi:MAG TPA: peptide ABC transporter substrate-binding protein [Chloroflexota bacterium]|nr:peptide ABC transporter substrate-binding protein [Chloroflexota bacterium]
MKRLSAMLLVAATISACTAQPQPGLPARPEGASAAPNQHRVLTIAIRYEIQRLIPKSYQSGIQENKALFTATLTRNQADGAIGPQLAEVPRLDTDTWRVFPDGRMETTYRLRPNLIWHDGQPLVADDFVFAWQVYTSSALDIFIRNPQQLMDSVTAPDPRTLVIHWSAPYPDANSLELEDLDPLPRHLLGEPFANIAQTGPDGFLALPYWVAEYVGAGPYRLVRWEPGASFEGVAFDGYVFGRPKIDRVILKVIPDDTSALTNVLAGTVDFTSLRFEQGQALMQEWVPSGKGSFTLDLGGAQSEWVQLRPEYVGHPGLLDVRVRRAIAHSLDRQAINEGVFEGRGTMAETMVPPFEPFYADVDRAVRHYPFDPRRAEELMNEAGYFKRDGLFANAAGERFSFDHITQSTGPEFERVELIMTDGWRRAGMEVRPSVLPSGQVGPGQQRHTFPGISGRGGGRLERNWITAEIGTPENRWTGENRSGWSNPEYDRLYEQFVATLDRATRTQQFVRMQQLLAEELPVYFTYFSVTSTIHVAGLKGPTASTTGTGTFTRGLGRCWNIDEWSWQ